MTRGNVYGYYLKDDEPNPFNLLDLDTDILNIIGDFVKKDNNKKSNKEKRRTN